MNRTLLLVVALAVVALLVPTGATPSDPLGTDTVSEDLVVEPADGPNGDYAIINEDDEIELLLTDANPNVSGDGLDGDALTPIPRVFTITNAGESAGEIWLTDDADQMEFYYGDDTDDSIEGSNNALILGPSDTVRIGLLVDTRGDHDVESAETFTIHAKPAGSSDRGNGGGSGDSTTGSGGTEDSTEETRNEQTADGRTTDEPGSAATSDGTVSDFASETDDVSTETQTAGDGGQVVANEGADSLPELGGVGLGPLLWILLTLVAVLIALGVARRYR